MQYTKDMEKVVRWVSEYCAEAGDVCERAEYYFAALLHLANADMTEMAENAEVNLLRSILGEECKNDFPETESQVLGELKKISDFEELAEALPYLNVAKKYAVESYQDEAATYHLLEAILHNPPDLVKRYVKEREDTLIVPKKEVEEILKLIF